MARYSGIILHDQSRQILLDYFQEFLRPLLAAGWQTQNRPAFGLMPEQLPHHMTIVTSALPENMKDLIGTEQKLTVFRWGESDQAAAVAVRTSIFSMAKIPHITMAISPIGKPYHSNLIQNWQDLDEELELIGIIEEIG